MKRNLNDFICGVVIMIMLHAIVFNIGLLFGFGFFIAKDIIQ